MESFSGDRLELTGSLISLDFDDEGRISELWASNPSLPEEGDEFQFVISPIGFGEEVAEDYYPGTILLGGRIADENSPWILSRSTAIQGEYQLETILGEENEVVKFDYDFPLLPEIQARGKYFELPGKMPQIVWEIELTNQSNDNIEIGELAFPLAFNNFYDGFGWSDRQLTELWNSRVYIHKFIGGAASWLFAQKMTGDPPGLLAFPGEDTEWEFFTHVQSSLNTSYQWEGIPVVYVYSRAVQEREGWGAWANGHSSLILKPHESKKFQMRFASIEHGNQDGIQKALLACDRPTVRLYPSAVAPKEVGIGVEITNKSALTFSTDVESKLTLDTDDNNHFCFIRPKKEGPLKLSFCDSEGKKSHIHLMFISSLEKLIKKRADWIVKNQFVTDRQSPFYHALVPLEVTEQGNLLNPNEFLQSFGVECSISEALFLAGKNTHYPDKKQIQILDHYISDFLQHKIQNPSNFSVSSVLDDNFQIGLYPGRPTLYPLVFNFYYAMYQISSSFGETKNDKSWYLTQAASTAQAMFDFGWQHFVWTVGLLGYPTLYKIVESLRKENLLQKYSILQSHMIRKTEAMVHQEYPFAGESVMDASGYHEVYHAAKHLFHDLQLKRSKKCVNAIRSLAPSWWWYGSDKRCWDNSSTAHLFSQSDKGEMCLAHTTIPNSLLFFDDLDRDYLALPEAQMRAAFGGMLGPWALVQPDGSAPMSYCPDRYSKMFGFNRFTGNSGIGLFHYLQSAASHIMPSREIGTCTFGCYFEQTDEKYVVKPWDGIGRKVVLKQIGAEFELTFGSIQELHLDITKRWFQIKIKNPAETAIDCELIVKGLWGTNIHTENQITKCENGVAKINITLESNTIQAISGKVTS